jgi:anthraniloyl-CoA monooxygenase
MRLRRVAVLGGGPGGLYAARLIKLTHPTAVVDVYEQGTPGTTFGFGVGLAVGTQRNLRAADPDSLEGILANAHPHDMSLRVGDRTVRMANKNLRAIARTTLLTVLQQHARDAGVGIHFGVRSEAQDLDADLVVAADGISSATRDARAVDFGAQIDVGDALYLWCGTEFALPRALFMPVTTDAGTFVTHAYPYSPDRSTFLIETDEHTWRRAGFDASTDALTTGPPEASDDVALAYLSQAFADPLEGHRLIGNHTRWLRFRTVRCERWHVGNVVLLGDAAHTAHYSIGSGTKLAMEDAIALVDALGEESDVASALDRYETLRRPAVEHLQSVAVRSQQWWDTFPARLDRPINQLLISYMTRAGKVPITRFAESSPSIVEAALAEYAGSQIALPVDPEELIGVVIDRPVTIGDVTYRTRQSDLPETTVDIELIDADPWGPKGDAAVAAGLEAVAAGAPALRITGPQERDALLARLQLAERLRGDVVPIAVHGTATDLPDLAAALLAGRTDLIDTR